MRWPNFFKSRSTASQQQDFGEIIVMAESEIRAASNISKESRRRRKRRTAEVSDSSSSSSSEAESDGGTGEALAEVYVLSEDDKDDVEIADNGVPSLEKLSQETSEALSRIPFTKTELVQKSQRDGNDNPIDLKRVGEAIDDAKQKMRETQDDSVATSDLKNAYLELLFENYGDDINSLRAAPDFTNNSLITLAHVLKDGSAMFDVETLKTMLESK